MYIVQYTMQYCVKELNEYEYEYEMAASIERSIPNKFAYTFVVNCLFIS